MKSIIKTTSLIILALLSSLGITAQNKKAMNNTKTLVAYFSCTGTTKAVAEKLAKEFGADLFEITPTKPYTSADLNWNNAQSRSSVEMKDKTSRPTIANKVTNIQAYDTIFIGYPIWWDLAPTIINTFLESYDFTGKVIVPFATSGSSSIANSESMLRKTYPKMKWHSGLLINGGVNKNMLKQWLEK